MRGIRRGVLALMLAAAVLAAVHPADAEYHPTLGRFVQRDPIGYKDGMNAYEYETSNPVTGLDPNGLWRIKRQGSAKAVAIADPLDTVEGLAEIIGLDPAQYRRWLSAGKALKDGTRVSPAGTVWGIRTQKQQIKGYPNFRIPNTIVAYWGGQASLDEKATFGKNWVGWDKNIAELKKRGFKVDEMTKFRTVLTAGLFNQMSGARDLHGLYYWGHGDYTGWHKWKELKSGGGGLRWVEQKVWVEGSLSWSLAKRHRIPGWSKRQSGDYWYQLTYKDFKAALKYKMGLGLFFGCYSQEARDKHHLVHNGPNSVFVGFTKKLTPVIGPVWMIHDNGRDAVERVLPWGSGKQGTRKQ